MTVHMQVEELLRQAEKVLREADAEVEYATRRHSANALSKCKKRRNAINAACNALHRATRA